MTNSALKLIVLRQTLYPELSVLHVGHAVAATTLEMGAFVLTFALIVWTFPGDLYTGRECIAHYSTRVYVALQFPELFKLSVAAMQIFDTEPNLLFLFGFVVLSVQNLSFRTATKMSSIAGSVSMMLAVMARLLARNAFYTMPQQLIIGLAL